jgi:hypothetical protein
MTATVFLPGILEYFASISATEELSVIQFPVLLDGFPLVLHVIHNVQKLDPGVRGQPTQMNGACNKAQSLAVKFYYVCLERDLLMCLTFIV